MKLLLFKFLSDMVGQRLCQLLKGIRCLVLHECVGPPLVT